MAYASQVNDTQHPSSLSFNTKLCLFRGDLSCDWEGLCYQEKTMTPKSSNNKTTKIGLQPIISRQIQTLASLESNYVSSEDEEEREEQVDELDQLEKEMESEEEMEDEEKTEDDLDAEDENNDDDDDYVDFCNLLTKSPASDAAVSRFVHTSFVSTSFCFSVTNEDDSSEDDNNDDTDDNREDENENDSDDEEFCWSSPQIDTCLGGFDPFAVSGLFIPSLLSAIASRPPPVPCKPDTDSDEHLDKELAQKLKDINKRWLEMYSTSDEDNFNVVDAENCLTSQAIKVTSNKAVHFCDKTTFIDILNKEEWAEDYEAARKGPWEQYHRDHMRFTNRIESMREPLSKVLVAEHRATVFRKFYETTDLVTDGQDSVMDILLTPPASS